jgi:hypothetical protein
MGKMASTTSVGLRGVELLKRYVCLIYHLSQLFVESEQERLSEVKDTTRVTPRQLEHTLSTTHQKEANNSTIDLTPNPDYTSPHLYLSHSHSHRRIRQL